MWGQGLWANIDFSTSLGARSYPVSGAFVAQAGYYRTIWGDFKGDSAGDLDPMYGYVRAFVQPEISLGYDSMALGFEMFPISILGFRWKRAWPNNREDLDAYDCANFDCLFENEIDIYEMDLTLGYGQIFFGGRWASRIYIDRSGESNVPTAIVDPEIGLAWTPETQDEIQSSIYFLGWQFSKEWQMFALSSWHRLNNSSDESQSSYLILNHNISNYSISAGLGAFKSDLKRQDTSAILQLKWAPLKGPGLF